MTTVTVVLPGLYTRCTCIWPGPVTVTVRVVEAPAARVPDIGATVTFLARPDGSETDQTTVPPRAVSVIAPLAGGTTSSVVGLTLSVPAPGRAIVVAVADADTGGDADTGDDADTGAGGDVCSVTAAGVLLVPALPPTVGMTLACDVALAPGVGVCPAFPSAGRASAGPALAPAARGQPRRGGGARPVT